MTTTALLTDGPLAGATVSIEVDAANQPPLALWLDTPHLDETAEILRWRITRYLRAPGPTAPDRGQPWRYLHADPLQA